MSVFLSKKDMSDLLVSAWEGGSAYWVADATYKFPLGMSEEAFERRAWGALPPEEKESWGSPERVPFYAMVAFLPPSVKWRIAFRPNEVVKERGEVYYLTPKNMREAVSGLVKKSPHVFARIKSGNWDASDADAWLQMAIFGEVVFG